MEATKTNWSSFFLLEVVLAITLLSYWCFPVTMNLLQDCFPVTMNLLQGVIVWFDWIRLVLNNLFYIFILVNTLIVLLIYISLHNPTRQTKSDLFDDYFADVPTVIHTSAFEYREIKPEFQAVKIVEECRCNDYEVVEETNPIHREPFSKESSKSYRRTKSEMQTGKKKNPYRRMESERVTKTASWRSESFDGLSSEEFRMTVETFITEKKKTLVRDFLRDYGVDQRLNGGFKQCQNGVEGTCEYGSGRRHGRSHSLVGDSGSSGYGSYVAISK